MSEVLPPAGEKIVADYLRADEDVAEMIDRRVVAVTPDDHTMPWVRLTQIGDADQSGGANHLIAFFFQLDCYAGADRRVDGERRGGQPEAERLARRVYAALARLNREQHQTDEAVVTAAAPKLGTRRADTDLDPARERFISTAYVWMHAK